MNRLVNFHIHSLYSDGLKSVPQLVDMLKKNGVSWFALTDHDSTEGFIKARLLAKDAGMHCVNGIELSVPLSACPCGFIDEGDNMHLLAYDFHPDTFSNQKFFSSPREAFSHIRKNGGLSLWAHPYHLYRRGQKKHIDEGQALILGRWLKTQGMDGMEAHYYDFSPSRREKLASIADDLDLIKGVGTDYHGWQGRDKPCLEAPEEPRILLDVLIERQTNRGSL